MRRRSLHLLGAFVVALGIALPASAQHTWNHEWTHIARGITDGPVFHAAGKDIHWYLQWNCPHGPGYGMHVNLDYRSFNIFGQERWYYLAKVYAYGPPNNHGSNEGVSKSGVIHVERVHSGSGYHFSFHAAHACHYGLRAQWN